MRRIALKALAGLYGSAALLLGSCIGYVLPDNCGFPRNVFLSANGDTRSIRGGRGCMASASAPMQEGTAAGATPWREGMNSCAGSGSR